MKSNDDNYIKTMAINLKTTFLMAITLLDHIVCIMITK